MTKARKTKRASASERRRLGWEKTDKAHPRGPHAETPAQTRARHREELSADRERRGVACACETGLRGGGARARKKQRRLPSTPDEIKRSWAAYSKTLKWKRGDDPFTRTVGLEHSSKGREIATPAIKGSVVKGSRGHCVFFVVFDSTLHKPYEVTSLCRGGKTWTGTHSYESLREAKAQAKFLASRDSSGR